MTRAELRWGFPFYSRHLIRAIAKGYRVGDHVLASLVVLHGDTFRALSHSGYWRSIPTAGSCHIKMDDPLISLGVIAVGHKLIDINDPKSGEVNTWVKFRGPLKPTAEEIVARKYLAVHPLKGDETGRRLRQELRTLAAKEEALPSAKHRNYIQ